MTETDQLEMQLFEPVTFNRVEMMLASLPPDDELKGPDPDAGFVADVKRRGVRYPIVVEWDGITGHPVTVHDGRKRIKAARKAGFETIPVEYSPDAGRIYLLGEGIALNQHRRDNPVSELAAIEEIYQTTGAPISEISKVLGLHPAKVSALMQLSALIPPLRDAFDLGHMAVTVAQAAAKLPEERQRELVPVLEETGKVTGPDVTDVKQVQTGELFRALELDGVFFTPDDTGPSAPPSPIDGFITDLEGLMIILGNVKEQGFGGTLDILDHRITKLLTKYHSQRDVDTLPF